MDAFQQLAIQRTAGRHRPLLVILGSFPNPAKPIPVVLFSLSSARRLTLVEPTRLESRKGRSLIRNQVQDGVQPHHLQQHTHTIIGAKER
jgi:hypothetical protein